MFSLHRQSSGDGDAKIIQKCENRFVELPEKYFNGGLAIETEHKSKDYRVSFLLCLIHFLLALGGRFSARELFSEEAL